MGSRRQTVPPAPSRNRALPGSAAGVSGHPGHLAVPQNMIVHRPAGPPKRAAQARALRNRHHRRRHWLQPWLALAGLTPAMAAHYIFWFARGYAIWLFIPGLAVAAAKCLQQKRPEHRIYAVVCALLATWWTVIVVHDGPAQGAGRWALVFLACPGIFPLAWLWWKYHEIRVADGEPEPEATPKDPVPIMIAMYVGAPGKPGAGITLSPMAPIEAGSRYRINLVLGSQTPETAIRLLPNFASALGPLGITRQQLLIEPVPGPSVDEPGPDHVAMLTVLNRKRPHMEIQEFTGPTLIRDRGVFADGPYQDGEMAYARLYKVDEHGRPMRGASGLWVGQQGSGKSRLLEHKILEHMHSGLFIVVFLDGMGGSSMPNLLEHVHWPAIHPTEWVRALQAMARLRIYRTAKQTKRRLGCFYATPEEPFVQIVIDECHQVLKIPDCVRLVKVLLQEAEKCGMGLDLVTHAPLMSELGDQSGVSGSNVIRDLVKDGNVGVFKTGSSWTKQVTIGNWAVDPQTLPARPGSHYLAGASLRQAPVRAIRCADPDGWASEAPKLRLLGGEEDAMDSGSGDYFGRWERFRQHDTGTVSEADINEQLDAMLGRGAVKPADTGAPSAAAGGQRCMSLILAFVRERGRVQRKDILTYLDGKYSESAVAKDLAALERAGAITSKHGKHGEWMTPEEAAKWREGQDGSSAE